MRAEAASSSPGAVTAPASTAAVSLGASSGRAAQQRGPDPSRLRLSGGRRGSSRSSPRLRPGRLRLPPGPRGPALGAPQAREDRSRPADRSRAAPEPGSIRLVRDCPKDRRGFLLDCGFDLVLPYALRLDLRRLVDCASSSGPAKSAGLSGKGASEAPEPGTAMQLSHRGRGLRDAQLRGGRLLIFRFAQRRLGPARPPAVDGIRLRNRTRSSTPRPTGLPAPGPRLPGSTKPSSISTFPSGAPLRFCASSAAASCSSFSSPCSMSRLPKSGASCWRRWRSRRAARRPMLLPGHGRPGVQERLSPSGYRPRGPNARPLHGVTFECEDSGAKDSFTWG